MGATTKVGPESPVGLIAHGKPVQVAGNCSIGEAAQIMRAANISSALVAGLPEQSPGIVTERDLARALAAGLGPMDRLSNVAVLHPVAVSSSMSVIDAAAKMLHDEIRHLLVVDEGDLVGILSIRDIMAVLLHSLTPEVWVETLREAV
ncbi:MAG TPA: CBS domain-containing protein, partial [Acidimicrobiales bacterium]|nr:CBS domain-containing protein [Acidimicrobiales bacterium]